MAPPGPAPGGGHPGAENRGTGSAAQGTPRGASPRASWTEAPRRPELGLRPVENLLARFTRPVFRKRSPAGATLMTDWPQLVGPALSAVTQPLRLVRGTLTVACSGPVAMELQHLGPQLMARINAASGAVIVEALRFVQQAPATRPQHRPAPKPVTLPGPLTARLDGVQHPELRAALEKMAKGVYRKR